MVVDDHQWLLGSVSASTCTSAVQSRYLFGQSLGGASEAFGVQPVLAV